MESSVFMLHHDQSLLTMIFERTEKLLMNVQLCRSDLKREGKRGWMMFKPKTNWKKFVPCNDPESFCFCLEKSLRSGESAKDCAHGESCASVERLSVFKSCVSIALLHIISNHELEFIGQQRRR